MTNVHWFDVDHNGLRNLIAERDKGFIVYELIQNAWDQEVSRVDVKFESGLDLGENSDVDRYFLSVEDDDPSGFSDLAHSFTLFAESEKKSDAEKRGRFNLGEKLVLACCVRAEIETVGKTIEFDELQGRIVTRNDRTAGSRFRAVLDLSAEERDEILAGINRVIVPDGIRTTFNGTALGHRKPIRSFLLRLPTLGMRENGDLFHTTRVTKVDLYEAETEGTIFEMGIPIVGIDGKFDVNIHQKVPMNLNRDNVTPSYLRSLRVGILNEASDLLDVEEADEVWVSDAAGDSRVSQLATNRVLDLRFGKKRVIFDPSDPEANSLAASKGYSVIHGRSLSKGHHAMVKQHSAALPASRVTPSPTPYSENGKPLKPVKEVTMAMAAFADLAQNVARETIERDITVEFVSDVTWPFAATFGPSCELTVNVGRRGHEFFESSDLVPQLDLLIHEFGHLYEGNHLSETYYRALTRIGAKLAMYAARNDRHHVFTT